MKYLQDLLSQAATFRAKRGRLAQNLRDVDAHFRRDMEALDNEHTSRIRNLESERQGALSSIESSGKRTISDYIRMKNSLQEYLAPVRKWCPKRGSYQYTPNPSRVNEAELTKLIRMLQEEGFIAWIKRTFRLGGYSSRESMALELCQKIEDACAFCDERIAEVETRIENDRSAQVTASRRKIEAENQRYTNACQDAERRQRDAKANAMAAISTFDTSAELSSMHAMLARMKAEADGFCGVWGEYAIPATMPKQVLLCDGKLTLPNHHGVDEAKPLPIWVDLFQSNIIVVTTSGSAATSGDSPEKAFVRKFLTRMLKTIPPGNCSYSVFDALHKGTSLERLIDVTNIGTTDLLFDLFTTDDRDSADVTCTERRKFLCHRPAEIIKHTAGKYKSLFEYIQKTDDYAFPLTWYVDFNFPDTPDDKLIADMRELFVNANASGYSFVFVTTPTGLTKIKELAQQTAGIDILHVDLDHRICQKGNVQVEYLGSGAPESDQIYNFMTVLKKFYEQGGAVDNRIDTVFAQHGIEPKNAAKRLVVPMALDSRGRLINLELGGAGSVHGFISGGTNSGKSTLLHTIILSACLHYHPNDLEIWLVDYKQTEFHLYKKNTPPHIKLIGVSKTADFTFSLLDRITEEASRRTELMNRFDVQNLEDYRKHQGEPGYVNIPRLFIVVDEFHEMSQFVATEMEYKDKLENILREYRAQGITCLLADQTFSTGLSGLTPAAKNQIGLRIAMRNEASPQEIKDTLEVDRAMYSDSMQRTIALMSQGEFIMKVYVRNARGELTDIKLEKFKGLFAKSDDIAPISHALRSMYAGQFTEDVLYVNTKEQAYWDENEPLALDQVDPLRYPDIRLYLGRSATLTPCFGLDLGRQPDENLAIVGGTAYQRWELLTSIIKSCRIRNYKLLVFMAEYSDLMSDFGRDIHALCTQVPGAEIFETTEAWCSKLSELEEAMNSRKNTEDTVCVFIGLEIANIEFSRLPDKGSKPAARQDFSAMLRYMTPVSPVTVEPEPAQSAEETTFNVMPIIDKLFSSGARNGIRCVTEISVYRQFSKILRIKDMCRHKIAFSMSADDCLMYMGNSNFQKNIGQNAIYSDGGKEVKKLLPYKLDT